MKFLKVCTRKKITVNGDTKNLWFQAGVIKETEKGDRYLTLFGQPETDFFIFEGQEETLPELQLER